jgi:HAD superfamily hydrolase (TIGR01484 family)
MEALRPLAEFAPADRARVRVVMTDIDDTLTEHGRLPAESYAAMERLHRAGLLVIPVTGRPAGWCDLIARQWPVDGVVGENGAMYFRYLDRERRMERVYAKDTATRAQDRAKLTRIGEEVLAEVPGAALASDQAYREADLAIDYCEDVAPLPAAAVERIVAIFERHGAVAKVSSIHVNGWFGRYDKLSMARRLLAEAFEIDADAARGEVVFVGDSPNDSPMFGFFPNAVGVANVLDFVDSLRHKPRWVANARAAAGFAELAEALLTARGTAQGTNRGCRAERS